MTALELKPCPFCGAADPEWLASHVVCDCGATSPRQDVDREYQADAMQALREWNRRADLAQPAHVLVKPLVWSDRFGPNSECSYDHITADSALGLYRVEWKGWKDFDPPTVCCGGAFIGCYNTIQSAKSAAQADYEARILAALEPHPDPRDEVTDAARDVLAERARQISVELFHPRSDDAYQARDLASAAACYCFAAAGYLMAHDGEPPKWWPWAKSWWKPSKDVPRRDLVKAGALILAEIERLDRAALAAAKEIK